MTSFEYASGLVSVVVGLVVARVLGGLGVLLRPSPDKEGVYL